MYDCIIIGGGLIGMLSALELDQAGLRVCLLERQECGQESTWAGGGIVSPLYPWRYSAPVTALARWSQAHYSALCDTLNAATGSDPEYTRSGMLILEDSERTTALEWAQQYDMTLQVLDTITAIRACEPLLNSTILSQSALWLPTIAQMRNPRLSRALRTYITHHARIHVHEHTAVTEICIHDKRVSGVRSVSKKINAAVVVVAAGAWSASLPLPHPPPITPVRGQMLAFKTAPGLLQRIVLSNRRYVIPRRDGHILAGSTLEHSGFAKHTTEQGFAALHHFATELIPALKNAEIVRHWAGLRPGSPDGVPYIGVHPEVAGLYFNSGHFRNGVVLGLASARLLADLISAAPPLLDPRPYALDTPRQADYSPDFC
jgi:glycine oxidase